MALYPLCYTLLHPKCVKKLSEFLSISKPIWNISLKPICIQPHRCKLTNITNILSIIHVIKVVKIILNFKPKPRLVFPPKCLQNGAGNGGVWGETHTSKGGLKGLLNSSSKNAPNVLHSSFQAKSLQKSLHTPWKFHLHL